MQQCPTACQANTDIHQVSYNFRRHFIQGIFDRINNHRYRLRERLTYFYGGNFDGFRQARNQISSAHLCHLLNRQRKSRTNIPFYLLGNSFTDKDIIFITHILDDILIHFIARHA